MCRSFRRPLIRSAVGVFALVLVVGACGSEDELGGTVVKDGLGCTVASVERDVTDVPVIEAGSEVGEATSATDLVAGEDEACKADAMKYLTVDLIGAKVADGKVFNTTFDDDQPLTLRLGQGQLLTGLETGLTDLAVGGRRQIVVPAAEAYGPDGDETLGIGPDEDLEFVVDLISLTDAPVFCNPKGTIATADGKPTEFELPTTPTTDEVKVTVLTPGDGEEVTAASYPTVNYLGISCSTGAEFDTSWGREPFQVALDGAAPTATVGSVIPGWTEGLTGQKVGSTVQLDIPAASAYGSTGRPPGIGPNDPLTFVVEILATTTETPDEPAVDDQTVETIPAESGE